MLIHITIEDRLSSIRRHGLVSPAAAEARGFAPVFGSRGSNRDVVQLLAIDSASSLPRRIIDDDLIDGAPANGGSVTRADLRVLELDEALREHSAFVPPVRVAYRCRPSVPYGDQAFRYITHVEAWYEGAIAWTMVRSVDELSKFMSQRPR